MVDSVVDVTSLIIQRCSKEHTRDIPQQGVLDMMIIINHVDSTVKLC